MDVLNTFYTWDRLVWRAWLSENSTKEKEIWLVFPLKVSGEKCLAYNDAVEEALCFGWIDSTVKKLDADHRLQRFSPRREGSNYSRANIERLIWLEGQGLLHPLVRALILPIISESYKFPADILESIRSDQTAWSNYLNFPASYQRIRIAYIDGARKRPAEFKRRLESFIRSARNNKMLGYGGINKYY
jgi:uncharacterized protein YdeI (YjbR/CyaY-like superfamily)